MRASFKFGIVAVLAGSLLSVPMSASAAPDGDDLDIYGLVGGTEIVMFQSDDTSFRSRRTITGLQSDASIVGIDYRVQDNKLYGVGNAGGIYSIDNRARATSVGRLTVALSGAVFGVDFNPAANALRIISDTGQNLRQPFATTPLVATVADTALTLPATAPATGTVPAVGVTAAAYTNNDSNAATATTLFDIDTTGDRVVIQSPANAGSLAPTGPLGLDVAQKVGFDILSERIAGSTDNNRAYASMQVNGRYRLYTVDLLTGRTAVQDDPFRADVIDIAIPTTQG